MTFFGYKETNKQTSKVYIFIDLDFNIVCIISVSNVNIYIDLDFNIVCIISVSNVNEFGENITQIFEEIVLQPTPLR